MTEARCASDQPAFAPIALNRAAAVLGLPPQSGTLSQALAHWTAVTAEVGAERLWGTASGRSAGAGAGLGTT
jgi:hypothetical protein